MKRPIFRIKVPIARWYRGHPTRFFGYAFLGTVFVIVGIPFSAQIFSTQKTLNSLTAKSEILEFIPQSPIDNAIPLDHARLSTTSDYGDDPVRSGKCIEKGIFLPAPQSHEILARTLDLLHITIIPSGTNNSGRLIVDGKEVVYSETVHINVKYDENDSCRSASPGSVRIPVAGPAVIGDDYRPQTSVDEPSLTLTDGAIDIFGRAEVFKPFSYFFSDTLFPATRIALPAGSRVRDCDGKATWWGYADTRFYKDPDKNDGVMTLALTTDANRLAIAFPGGAKTMRGSEAVCAASLGTNFAARSRSAGNPGVTRAEDVVEISLLTRLLADPYLSISWVVITFLILVVQVITTLHTLPLTASKSDEAEQK